MGLDAYVYCDCLEKGRLRDPLPDDATVQVEPDGYPVIVRSGEEITEDHRDWSKFECGHERRALIHHRLGNIGLISLIRGELNRECARFPVLLEKVVYSGIHAGDYLPLNLVPDVQKEIDALRSFECAGNFPTGRLARLAAVFRLSHYHYTSARDSAEFIRVFRAQMQELAEAALRVGKPIAF